MNHTRFKEISKFLKAENVPTTSFDDPAPTKSTTEMQVQAAKHKVLKKAFHPLLGGTPRCYSCNICRK